MLRRRLVFVARHRALQPGRRRRCSAPATASPPATCPDSCRDRAFWKMVVDFSEPDGFFRSDNFISNETTFQEVIPELRKRVSPNGVYLGVGPDQNFTYIAALQPRMAFIIDIRRQNMMQHLMYKAIIEMSDDRADFMSRLFSRPRPGGMTRTTPAADDARRRSAAGLERDAVPEEPRGGPEPAGEAARVSAFRSRTAAASSTCTARSFPKGRSCGIPSRGSRSARAGFRPTAS